MEAISTLFNSLTNIGTGIAFSVAVFFLVVGAIQYMAASGSPHQLEKGKSTMVNALFGLAIVLSAATGVPLVARAGAAALCFGAALLVALVRPYGRGVEEWAVVALRYATT